MTRINSVFSRAAWVFVHASSRMFLALAIGFLAISWQPVLSLWRAGFAGLLFGLFSAVHILCWLVAFEFRLFCFRRMDARVPLQPGDRILVSELATQPGDITPRAGGLYLTARSLVFLPVRRRFPTVVLPRDKTVRFDLAPRSVRDAFQGGLRARLHARRQGGGEYFFIVWKPNWWSKVLRGASMETAS